MIFKHSTRPSWMPDLDCSTSRSRTGWRTARSDGSIPLFAPKPRPPQVTGILGQEVGPSSRQDAGGAPSVRSQAARRDAGGTARANEALRYSLSAKLALDYQALPGR